MHTISYPSFTLALERPLVLVAHQDDEAVGCNLLLQRSHDPLLVFATDGAPHDIFFWKDFGSRENYAQVRRREALVAAGHSRVENVVFLANGNEPEKYLDQELHLSLRPALARLFELALEHRIKNVVTSAYEGGHPDHDCCAFLGHTLAQRLRTPAWEFPLYHRDLHGRYVRQEFMFRTGNEMAFTGTEEEMERKQAAISSHVSQRHVLADFNWSNELFRPMAAYDFSRKPHEGQLNYEAWGWQATGDRLVECFLESDRRARHKTV